MTTSTRNGFTIIELLASIAIVGVVLAMLLPAVQKARESARKTECKNNLRQMGVALLAHESQYGGLPPGRNADKGRNHSWATAVLPFLDQSALAENYHWDQAWNAALNRNVTDSDLVVFRCPSALENWAGKSDYGGNYGSSLTGLTPGFQRGFGWESGTLPPIEIQMPGDYRSEGVRFGEVSDGASQTFLVLEDADRPARQGGMWGNGHNCFAHDNGPINGQNSHEIFSRHPGGAHALFADGSTQFLSESTDLLVLGALATRSQGEVVAQQ
jgi:prepilin-type N-terminal cleavage/methylation domain-containing protein/prepilin-type processing-associated H-X9-DG protein